MLRRFASPMCGAALGTCRNSYGRPTERDTVAHGTCGLTRTASPRSQRDHARSQSLDALTLCRIWHAGCERGDRPVAGRETHRAVAHSRRRAAPDHRPAVGEREGRMERVVRRRMEMAVHARDFNRTHPSADANHASVLAELEETIK